MAGPYTIGVTDLLSYPISIQTAAGDAVSIPWGSSSAVIQAPIVTASEFTALKGLTTDGTSSNPVDQYAEIITRTNFLDEQFNAGNTVSIGGQDFVKGTNDEGYRNLIKAIHIAHEKMFDEAINVQPTAQGLFRAQGPHAQPAGHPNKLNTALRTIAETDRLSEIDAIDYLAGPQEISLQIGYVVFGANDLGPDGVVFADINEVRSAATLRSDTDVAVKVHGGRAFLELDLVFASSETINAKLRPLLGMLKMAPIIPVSGRAINAAMINQVNAHDAFEELRNAYTTARIKGDLGTKQAFELARESLGPNAQVPLGELKFIFQNEREALDILRRWLEESHQAGLKADTNEEAGFATPKLSDAIRNKSNVPVSLALVSDSITVTTIAAAPGALRVRLSFQKMSDSYLPPGGMSFINEKGDATFDIRKSVLKPAVEAAYLSHKRQNPTSEGALKAEDNIFYIPKIGEGASLASLDPKRVTHQTSELGHTMYRPASAGNPLGDSPILFRFSSPLDPGTIYDYVPSDMVLRSMTWNYTNKIAAIDIEGQLYPTFQHMGMGLVSASMAFDTTSSKAVTKMMAIKSTMDQHSTHDTTSSLFRREFLDIHNDVLNLTAYKRFLINSIKVETDPDNPDLYHIALDVVSNEESVREREALEVKAGNRGKNGDIRAFWWWMYAGLVARFLSTGGASGGDDRSDIFRVPAGSNSGVNPDYTDIFRDLMRGRLRNSIYDNPDIEGGIDASRFLGVGFEGDIFKGGQDSVYGAIGTGGEKSSHSKWELDLIWDMVFGVPIDNSEYKKSGIMDHNLFRAAFMEVIKQGQAGKGLSWDDAQDEYLNHSGDVGSLTFSSFLKQAIGASERSGENRPDGFWETVFGGYDPDFKLPGGLADDDYIEIGNLMDSIIRRYKNNKDANDIGTTSWFITAGWNTEQMDDYLRFIKNGLEDGPQKSPNSDEIATDFLFENVDRSARPAWIPTPALWEQLFYVIHNYDKLLSSHQLIVQGVPAGYEVSVSGTDQHVFLVTDTVRSMRDVLSALVGDPAWKAKFSSFWKNRRPRETADSIKISDINILGSPEANINRWSIDPKIFEARNAYIDLALPRYSDIFTESISANKVPTPSVAGGFEVWKKVAPTYLELGIKPDMFQSMTSVLLDPPGETGANVAVKYPSLLTPRAFFDYCEPGFFYYKKSWLLEKYKEMIQKITDETASTGGALHPLGDSPDGDFSLSAKEFRLRKLIGDTGCEPISLDFTFKEVADREAPILPGGVKSRRTAAPPTERDIGTWVLKQLNSKLNDSVKSSTSIGSVPVDLTKLSLLADRTIRRVPVVDRLGKVVGLVVANYVKGAKGSRMLKLDLKHSITSRIAQGRQNNDDTAEYGFIYIDSDAGPAKADQITYQDSQGVLKYNMYDGAGAAAIFKETIAHASDLKANHIRAYPTFKLFFVREKLVGDQMYHYLEDDMYGYSSVISIDVTTDKEDAATAVVVLTDISGRLSIEQFESDIISAGPEAGKELDLVDGDRSIGSSTTAFDDDRYDVHNVPKKVKLEVGTNIVIKLGYGHDANTLKTVFTGAIAEIQPGSITTIVAQGYKAELYKHINFYKSVDFFGGMIDDLLFDRKKVVQTGSGAHTSTAISSNYLIMNVLTKLATVPGVDPQDQYSGLPHFGTFMSLAQYKSQSPRIKARMSNSYLNSRDRVLAEDNLLTTIGKMAIGMGGQAGQAGAMNLMAGAALKGLSNYFNDYSEHFMHTNAMKNVFWDEDVNCSFMDSLSAEWLANSDGWQCLKEITRYKVGYICQVLPYGNKATLFIGRPDMLYHYKPVPHDVLNSYSRALPIVAQSVRALTFWSVLSRFFNSDAFGLTGGKSAWKEYIVSRLWASGEASMSVWEKNLINMSFEDSLTEYINIIASKVKLLGIATEGDRLINLTEDISDFRDISEFPSFAITRFIVGSLKKDILSTTEPDIPIRYPKLGALVGSPTESLARQAARMHDPLVGGMQANYVKTYPFHIDRSAYIPFEGDADNNVIAIVQFRLPKDGDGTFLSDFSADTLEEKQYANQTVHGLTRGIVGNMRSGRISIRDIADAGYNPKEYIAFTLGGELVHSGTLRDKFKINPMTGRPFDGHHLSRMHSHGDSYEVGPYGIGEDPNIAGGFPNFASELGFTEGVNSQLSNYSEKSKGKIDYNIYHRNAEVDAINYITGNKFMILLDDRTHDLEKLLSYNKTLVKLAFATFFEIGYQEGEASMHGVSNPVLSFPDPLDSVWFDYVKAIMQGLRFAKREEWSMETETDAEMMNAFYDAVGSPEDGVLAPLTKGVDLKYGEVKSSNKPISPEMLRDAANIFSARLRDMVKSGQITRAELPRHQARFRSFLRLAKLGKLSANFTDAIGDIGTTIDSLSDYVFTSQVGGGTVNGKPFFPPIQDTGADVLDDFDQMMIAATDTAGETQQAMTELLGLPPSEIFDPRNPIHMTQAIGLLGAAAEDFDSVTQKLTGKQKGLIREVIANSLKEDPPYSGSLVFPEIPRGTRDLLNSLGDEFVYNDLEILTPYSADGFGNPEIDGKGMARGENGDSMFRVLLSNADDFKIFLTFLAKWLSEEGSDLKDTIAPRSLTAMQKVTDSIVAPGVKRFSDTHLILSGYDIIENKIVATMSEMANNILLMTVKRLEVESSNNSDAEDAAIWRLDPEDTDYIPYPNYQTSGVDYHPFVKAELRKQRVVIEKNAETDVQRAGLLISHMAEAIRPMYRGHLKIIGRPIKPYDRIMLADTYNDMVGLIEVERATHTFHADTGWVTTIVPCAMVHPVDAIADIISKFDTSDADTAFFVLDITEWFLEGLTILGLVGALFAGPAAPAPLAVSATAQGAKFGLKSFGKKVISRGIAAGIRRVIAAGYRRNLDKYIAIVTKRILKAKGKKGLAKFSTEQIKEFAIKFAGGQAAAATNRMSLAFVGAMGNAAGFAFSRRAMLYGIGLGATGAARRGFGIVSNMAAEMNMQSATLPIHTYCLTRYGRPLQAGLDMDITRFYTFNERLGMSVDSIYRNVNNFVADAFKIRRDEVIGGDQIFGIVEKAYSPLGK